MCVYSPEQQEQRNIKDLRRNKRKKTGTKRGFMAGIGNINVLLYVRFCKLCYEEGVSVSWKVNTMLFNALLEKVMADESLRPKPSKTKRGRKTYTQKFRELKIKDYWVMMTQTWTTILRMRK